MKFNLLLLALITSIVINIVLFFNFNNQNLEENVEQSLNRMIHDAAFQIQEEMTEEHYIRMNQIFKDIEVLSRNTQEEYDHSHAVWESITIINQILTSVDNNVLGLESESRREISYAISNSIETNNIREMEQNVRDILNEEHSQ